VFPAQRSAKVSIRLHGGRELFQHQSTRKGDPDAPLSDVELDEKFLELAAPVVGDAPARALLAQLWNGKALPGSVSLLPG
jgi:chemotaxis receptor (MCP) glutamine deamidase CheD